MNKYNSRILKVQFLIQLRLKMLFVLREIQKIAVKIKFLFTMFKLHKIQPNSILNLGHRAVFKKKWE